MRRPAPLPNPSPPQATPAPASARAARDEPRAPLVAEPVAPPTAAPAERPLTSRDVWRAARARRQRLRSEIRRFTKTARRRRQMWALGISAVLLLVVGSFGVAYSPLFAVEKITLVGASDTAAIEEALASQRGIPLPLVDEQAIEDALRTFPRIESFAVEARPPHELLIRLVERTPVGVVAQNAGYALVDAAGVVLGTSAEAPAGYPIIDVEGGTSSAAFTAAGAVIRAVPEALRATVTTVTAATPDSVTLALSEGKTIVWGSAEQSAYKALVLERMMQARPDATSIDVSSPDAVVVG